MKTDIRIILSLALFCLLSLRVSAQELGLTSAEKRYYNEHPEKILPDAKESFTKSEYLQTQKLCRFHSFVLMDEQVQERKELWADAEKCAALAEEMLSLKDEGKIKEAKQMAEALLKINPDDKAANEIRLMEVSAPVQSQSQSQSQSQPSQNSLSTEPNQEIHEWVDLGLSVKWATCNLGASSPEEFGDYYAWGEIEPKSEYTWANYKFRTSGDSYNNVNFNKYNTKSTMGTVDNKTTLEMADDVARAKPGGSWRIPTKAEFDELQENCTWTWIDQGGHNGYKVTSKKNGNSIFLPAAGGYYGTTFFNAGTGGYYWSSSLRVNYPYSAYELDFYRTNVKIYYISRYYARTIRPVTE